MLLRLKFQLEGLAHCGPPPECGPCVPRESASDQTCERYSALASCQEMLSNHRFRLRSPPNSSLERALLCAAPGESVHVRVCELVLQCGYDLILASEKIGSGQIDIPDGVMRDKEAVTGEVLHKEQQLLTR